MSKYALISFLLLFCQVAVAEGSVTARVEKGGGIPHLVINGKPTPPLILFVNIDLSDPQNAVQTGAEIRLAARSGIHLVSFQIPIGLADPTHDFQAVDRWFAFVLRNDPQAYLLPRVWCGGAVFDREYPNDMVHYSNGDRPMASVASNRWYRAARSGLNSLIQHVQHSQFADRVIGYHLCYGNTGEWFTPDYWDRPGFDYSQPNRLGFVEYLRRRYHNVKNLRRAWQNPAVTFSSVVIPPPTKAQSTFYSPAERRYVDYLNYQSAITAERIIGLASLVKKETRGRSLVIVFYGYDFECPYNDNSHRALNQLLNCRDIDAFASPVSYGDRKPGGCSPFMGPVDSAILHGKLWFLEDDTRTFAGISTPLEKTDPASASRCKNLAQTNGVHERNFGQMMVHRLGTWWMDLFGVGWLNNAAIWQNIADLRLAYQKADIERPFTPQVAVVYDEHSPSYVRAERNEPLLVSLLAEPTQFYRCGAGVGFYLLNDIRRANFPSAKVVVFLDAWRLKASMRRLIIKKLGCGGRTLIWIYGAGFINRDGGMDAKSASRLIGMRIQRRPAGESLSCRIQSHNFLRLPDAAEDGLRISGLPSFSVNDPAAAPIARYDQGDGVAIALKRFKHYQSLFIGETRLSPAFWRALLLRLGVRIYLNTDDAFETDGQTFMIHVATAGVRRLHLLHRSDVYNLLTGRKLAADTRTCDLQFQPFQTRLLRVIPLHSDRREKRER